MMFLHMQYLILRYVLCVFVCVLSCFSRVQLFATLKTVAL